MCVSSNLKETIRITVSREGIEIDRAKMWEMPIPKTNNQSREFFGWLNYIGWFSDDGHLHTSI